MVPHRWRTSQSQVSKKGVATKAVPTRAKAFANISGVAAIVLRFVTSFVKWSIGCRPVLPAAAIVALGVYWASLSVSSVHRHQATGPSCFVCKAGAMLASSK